MPNLDETELARLEALAAKASKTPFFPDGFDVQDDFDQTVCRCNWVNDLAEDVQEANAHYIAAACNAVPALVAEVRRLREERAVMLSDMDAVKTKAEPCDDCWTIYMLMREIGIEEKNWFHRDVCARLTAMQNAEEENAALLEKVEAWEWFGECRSLILWRGPENEMMEIFNAAREAVHADRE